MTIEKARSLFKSERRIYGDRKAWARYHDRCETARRIEKLVEQREER